MSDNHPFTFSYVRPFRTPKAAHPTSGLPSAQNSTDICALQIAFRPYFQATRPVRSAQKSATHFSRGERYFGLTGLARVPDHFKPSFVSSQRPSLLGAIMSGLPS